MSSGTSPMASPKDPAEHWHALLKPYVASSREFTEKFYATLRAHKLTFGNRVHCPFLRPFFLSPEDEQRVRTVAEKMAELGERVAAAALSDPALFKQLRLREGEERLARMHTGFGPASTASRLDAFLLPDSLKFAEYNGESPAGSGYTETLSEVFRDLPVMKEFARSFEIHSYPLSAKLLDALIATYLDWGGDSKRPQMLITDWREVPTWSEFEILKARFEKMGVPVEIADPRDLVFDGKTLSANGKKIDLVYRRVLINDILARPAECKALVDAYQANVVCVANNFRCKIPHVKAFFAVLTDEKNGGIFSFDEREMIKKHVPWTRVMADVQTAHYGEHIELLAYVRRERERMVLKPSDEYGGTGVTLGWETNEAAWDAAIEKAISTKDGAWIVQERIPIRREVYPWVKPDGNVEFRDMLVDFAPYLFRGKLAGFLTRLSATGLANVTSGGGQVPAFRVCAKN
ncbi:MAG: circularly permuted type 2 ATP-grasp protein [Acidobacteria bacterium]|nr:circularly permuted type 2 ATP-grasp protein [Acidobacteriota bacterium]MBS1864789.1 circularly permuted type 2 ATP-grasp protein [Acidobacteriota bacterium]